VTRQAETILGPKEKDKMSSGSLRTFTDVDQYAAELQHGPVELTIRQRGLFTARLWTVELHDLVIQHQSEELARTSHVDSRSDRAFIAFRMEPGPAVIRNGVELTTTRIARLRPGQSYYQRTSGPTLHCALFLPLDKMEAMCAIGECPPTPKDDDVTISPSPEAMARLQRLAKTAADLAEDAPVVLAHPEFARGLEQALIEAMMACLVGEGYEDRATVRHHAAIMRRFHGVIEQSLDQLLFIPELCKKIGVSIRTLNACCHEHLGMGAKRFLLLRRMHMAQRALRDSTPGETTVTEIATRYGFWQFGRFAIEYKALFGEAPSATLARMP
jgi:AraC-like DNA-binding protein